MQAKKNLAESLKERLRAKGPDHSDPSRIRIHRAISWLARAEAEASDPDARFVFLWIAFNAAYAHELGQDESARTQLSAFFEKLLALDAEKRLAGV